MKKAYLLELLHRVRRCVPRANLRYDPSLANEIDVALCDNKYYPVGAGDSDRMHEPNLSIKRTGLDG